jgi:hypothetical protein
MALDKNLKKVIILGSGPIIIGRQRNLITQEHKLVKL